jgi:hypothetical protein
MATLFPLPPITGKKPSKRKSPSFNRIKVDHTIAKQRYYSHRRLKEYFPIDGAKRMIDVSPYQSLEEIPKRPQKHLRILIDLGYNAQTTIPCPKILTPPKQKEPRKKKVPITPGG